MDINKYLKRINFTEEIAVNYNTLKALQTAHYNSVPYENIDILLEKPLSLLTEDVYNKVVLQNRGGYCFELNGLYYWLLKELGFTVKEKLARFLLGEEGLSNGVIPMGRHRVLIVSLPDGDYVTDVGIGCPTPTEPIKLEYDKITEMRGSKYKLIQDEKLYSVVNFDYNGEWKPYYSFGDDFNYPADFDAPSLYCELSEKSIFNKGVMCHIFTQNGRKTIEKNMFVVYNKQDKTHTLIDNANTLANIFSNEFGLMFNENEIKMLYSNIEIYKYC